MIFDSFRKQYSKRYYNCLIKTLNEILEFNSDCKYNLNVLFDYCNSVFNKQSATDNTQLLRLKNLLDKVSDYEKYIEVSINYYEALENA